MIQAYPSAFGLVGLCWAQAEQVLRERGQTYRATITYPPNRTHGIEPLRVIAEKTDSDGLMLVLAYRDYRREDQR